MIGGLFVDAEGKKHSLRMINYGLYILTAKENNEVAAGTINWLSQASFTPPLVMVGIKADSHLHTVIQHRGQFAVSILDQSQKALAQDFFRPSTYDGLLLSGHATDPGPTTGAPILKETPGWFEVEVRQAISIGDHTVYIAEVVDAGVRDKAAIPLVMRETGWFYGG